MLDGKLADLRSGALRFVQPLGGVANDLSSMISSNMRVFLRITNNCIFQTSDSIDLGNHFVAHLDVRPDLAVYRSKSYRPGDRVINSLR